VRDETRRDLEEIAAQSRSASARYRPPHFGTIGTNRPFVPETFTQLYHTPRYRDLDDAQCLRYNQLYGLRSNELFMLFEEGFTRRVIQRLEAGCAASDPLLGECLGMMLEEESRHHRMFLDFNRRVLPEAYRDARGYFARPGPIESGLLRLLTQRPQSWPFMLWLILLLEEFSTAFSGLLIAREQADGLSADYVRLHRLHMLDEVRHVGLDEAMLERILPRLSPRRLAMNGWVFRQLLNEMLAPKRSGIRVLRALAADFPELSGMLPGMENAVRELRQDPGIFALVASTETLPVTHAMMDRFPAFFGFHPSTGISA
jgi:hypothetical protein